MDALRNYLACQADLGTDEVVLTRVLAPRGSPRPPAPAGPAAPQARSASPVSMAAAPTARPAQEPAPGETAPAGLFQMLVKSLEESEVSARAAKANDNGLALRASSQAGRPDSPALALPAFASLSECRAWLDGNLRSLLTGEALGAAARLIHGLGPERAPLALVAMEPGAEDLAAGHPFGGQAGLLLEKMMRAIRLDLSTLYRTLVVKAASSGRAGGVRGWTRRDLIRLLPLLHAELALAKVPVVLLLGETCAQAVLKTGRPLDELRGSFHRVEGIPESRFAVTYHPDDLAGNEDLKRKAWKDLQWLQPSLPGI